MSILGAVQTAVSGLNAQSHAFTDVSNNIANSNTVGYKSTTTSFDDYVTNMGPGFEDGIAKSDSVVATTQQHNENQGTIAASENPLAIAVSGAGFFNVQKPASSPTPGQVNFDGHQYYTRNGDFTQDANGFLKNTSGYCLDGFQVGADGKLSQTLAPIQIKNVVSTTNPAAAYNGINIQPDGSIMASFNDGTSQLVATIPLTKFPNSNGLKTEDGQAYTATSIAGPSSGPLGINTNGVGSLVVGSLESSTTDMTGNLTQLIVDQQAYGANTKVVSTANQILQTTLAMIQ